MSENNSSNNQLLITIAGTVITACITAVIGPSVVELIKSRLPSTPQAPTPSPTAPATTSPLASPDEQKYDLTGVWETEGSSKVGHATFYVRQDGSTVWWYGQGDDWFHVLKGTLSGTKISAEWADIPVSDKSPQNRGTMTVIVNSEQTEMTADDSNIRYQLKRTR